MEIKNQIRTDPVTPEAGIVYNCVFSLLYPLYKVTFGVDPEQYLLHNKRIPHIHENRNKE